MRILLIKKGALGDVLMTTPLIRQLKNSQNCQIDYIVGKSSALILKDNPYIDQLHVLDDDVFMSKNVFKLAKYYFSLRGKYDYVFVLDKHWYFALLTKLIGGVLVGFYRDLPSRYLLNKMVRYDNVNHYQGYYYLDLLTACNLCAVNYEDIKLDLIVTTTDIANVCTKLNSLNVGDYVVIVNSGGNNSFEKTGIRMLPQKVFQQLVQVLLESGTTVILSGGKVDFENNQKLICLLGNPAKLYNFAGDLSFSETGALFASATHVYTTDCGAMHLAVSVIPHKFTGYFAITSPKHFLPICLQSHARWYDEAIYNKNYQLYGEMRGKEPQYFTQLQFPRDL